MSDPATIFNIVFSLLVLSMLGVLMTGKKEDKIWLPYSNYGLPLESQLPFFEAVTIKGEILPTILESGKEKVLIATALGCSACDGIYPIVTELHKKTGVDIALLVDGDKEDIDKKIEKYKIEVPVYQMTRDIGKILQVSRIPYAYYLSSSGHIYSKGSTANAKQLNLLISEGAQLDAIRNKDHKKFEFKKVV